MPRYFHYNHDNGSILRSSRIIFNKCLSSENISKLLIFSVSSMNCIYGNLADKSPIKFYINCYWLQVHLVLNFCSILYKKVFLYLTPLEHVLVDMPINEAKANLLNIFWGISKANMKCKNLLMKLIRMFIELQRFIKK